MSIADQGCGIPPESQTHIFDPFFTTKDFGDGAGMGLSVVLGIVQSHGGFVKFRSKPGRGTVVSLFLPICPDQVPHLPGPLKYPEPTGGDRLILVADPSEMMCQVLRTQLSACGFRVTVANDAVTASAQVEVLSSEVALMIVDLKMPEVQGKTLIQHLAQRAPKLPLLAMSDDKLGADETFHLQNLVRGILLKPFNSDGLLDSIHEILPVAAKCEPA